MNPITSKTYHPLLIASVAVASLGTTLIFAPQVTAQPEEKTASPAASPQPTDVPVPQVPAPLPAPILPPVPSPPTLPDPISPPGVTSPLAPPPITEAKIPSTTTTPSGFSLPPVPKVSAPSRSTKAVGPITGTGTTGNIAKFIGSNAIGNSVLIEKSGKVGLGTTVPTGSLSVVSNSSSPSIYGSNAGAGAALQALSKGGVGVQGETNSTGNTAAGVLGRINLTAPGITSAGVRGINNSTNTKGYGVYGSHAGNGPGVYGTSVGGSAISGTSATGNGVYGTSTKGIGVRGSYTGTGTNPGVLGETNSTVANATAVQGVINSTKAGASSAAVRGINKGTTGLAMGVYGSYSGPGYGVYGLASGGTGIVGEGGTGVSGIATSSSGNGVVGTSQSGTGVYGSSSYLGVRGDGGGYGVYGTAPNGYGVAGSGSTGIYGSGNTGVYGAGSSFGLQGVTGSEGIGVSGESANNIGVSGTSGYIGVSAKGGTYGVFATSVDNYAVVGTSTNGYGLYGTSANNTAVFGSSTNQRGVFGKSTKSFGVEGDSVDNVGVAGYGTNNYGMYAYSTNNIGVVGATSNANSYAGYFNGNVYVRGNLGKASGSFKIDHPLHPGTQYLSHSFVESPDMMNVYNGNATLDSKGQALITLPTYFQALNRDFRYQLTPIGAPASLYVAKEISGNHFSIAGGKAGMKVSWQVTGIRNDAYARDHRIQVEETKTTADQGKYLYPAGFGAGNDKLIGPVAPHLASR